MRAGESRVLVLRGEAGVGKTALLDYLRRRAVGYQAVHAAGVQSEMELAFSGLHQLLSPMLSRLESLPVPQQTALRTAFGMSNGRAPDQFLVGLAVLGLLSEVAAERPLLCVIDDEQWLDRASAQILGFVARRLAADPVALVFAARVRDDELAGLPEVVVDGLSHADARELLGVTLTGPLDSRARDQIVAETRGNPLALIELTRGLSTAELAGFRLPGAAPLDGQIEDGFLRRLAALPAQTRRLLQVAAADPTGDPSLVWRAAALLGVPSHAAAPAAEARLAEFGIRVVFRHPLVRSAVSRSASHSERQQVHAALATATDPVADPDRRAWHRATAADGPDEEVAAELERSAGRAQARGGLSATAAFLERAAALTYDLPRRADRLLAAAHASLRAGAFDKALELIAAAEAGPLDEFQGTQPELIRAQIAYAQNRGSDAPSLLLHAARRLDPVDRRLARVTYLDALSAATFADSSLGEVGVLEVAEAVLAAPRPADPPRPLDLLLEGVATQRTQGYAAGVPMLRQALDALLSEELPVEEQLECSLLTYRAVVDLWDDESWYVLTSRNVRIARESGALVMLQFALNAQIVSAAFAGELGAGSSLIAELHAVCDALGSHFLPYSALAVAAWRGREAEVSHLVNATTTGVVERGEELALSTAHWANAVLYNSLGRYEDALIGAERACAYQNMAFSDWSLAELILAAVRCGKPERAADAFQQLVARARDSESGWARGIEARSRALLSKDEAAERYYLESIEWLARTRVRTELARSHLLYGQWLRRERRRGEARRQLRTAYQMLEAMGVEGFAEQARREMLATGGPGGKDTVTSARTPSAAARRSLTVQETQVARLARDGLTNPEIAARLFISPRTVQYHLSKVFAKLGIGSRGQLIRALPDADPMLPR